MSKDTDKLLATLRKQFEQDCKDEKTIRDEAQKDLAFVAGDQWNSALKARRIAADRPALTFARCHTFVQQVANEARQQKPQVKFVPSEDGDDDTAEVYEGLARHIQYDSDAQEAFENAVDYQAGGGFGFYKFTKEYCDNEGWDQDLKVVPVHDPFSIYGVLLPACFGYEPKHAFETEDMLMDDYKAEYPDSDVCSFTADDYAKADGWIQEDKVRLAGYWYVEEETSDLTRKNPETGEEETRKVTKKTVHYFKTNGVEILPGTETVWQDEVIPIWPVLGKKMIVKGKPILFSVVRYQRDPQQLINIYKSRIAETLGTAPISPFMVEEGTVNESNKKDWDQLNTRMVPYLTYKGTNLVGQKANVPQRQVYEPPIASLSEAAAQEIDDMKATAGIFDASLGAKGNETSGIGIARRQQQSDAVNMHYLDNLARSFSKSGRALARLIPVTYDGARMVRILGVDETPKIVKINQEFKEGSKTKRYDIGGEGIAKFDVIVTMARAYSSKRMESFDQMGQVIQSAPGILNLIGDIYFKNSDMAGADQIAERFKKQLPPNLQDDAEQDVVIPPQVKQTLDQLTQQHQLLTQTNDTLTQEVKTQQSIKQMQLDSDERMKQMELDSQERRFILGLENARDIAEIGAKSQDALTRAKLDGDLNNKLQVQDHAQAHETAMRAAEVGHEVAMSDKGHMQAQDAAAQQAAMQPDPQTQD